MWFSLTFVMLFAGIGTCFFQTPYAADDLKYPSKSIIETLFSAQRSPSDLEHLEYPKQSLISTILAKIVGSFTQVMVSWITTCSDKISTLASFSRQFEALI